MRRAICHLPNGHYILYILYYLLYIIDSILLIIYYRFYIIYYQLYIIYYYDTHSMLRIKPSYLARFTAE